MAKHAVAKAGTFIAVDAQEPLMRLEPITTASITDWVIQVRRGGTSSVPRNWLCRVCVHVDNLVVAEAAREVNLGSFWEGIRVDAMYLVSILGLRRPRRTP